MYNAIKFIFLVENKKERLPWEKKENQDGEYGEHFLFSHLFVPYILNTFLSLKFNLWAKLNVKNTL